MSTLKDIQFSQQGEPKVKQRDSSLNFMPDEPSGEQHTEPDQAFVIFKLTNKNRRKFWLDGICDNVLNKKTGRKERIWLLNGADSIWQSELIELLKDKEYVNRNRRSILFEQSMALVKADDQNALEFLRNHKDNVGKQRNIKGKRTFYEYDAAEEQKWRFEKQNRRIDMILKAQQMPEEKVKKLAWFFNIGMYDEIGRPKTPDGLRTELILMADNRPDDFAKYIDSREVDVSFLVRKAILDAKIDLTGQQGNAIWANGKGFICKIPAARKAVEYLTELAMTNSDDGKKFLEQLQTLT